MKELGNIQVVKKILPDWKVQKFFLSRIFYKSVAIQKRVSVKTKLKQYTCRFSCILQGK